MLYRPPIPFPMCGLAFSALFDSCRVLMMCRQLVRRMAPLRRYCAACGSFHRKISNHWKEFTVRDAHRDDPEAAIHKDTLKVYQFGSTVYILAERPPRRAQTTPG